MAALGMVLTLWAPVFAQPFKTTSVAPPPPPAPIPVPHAVGALMIAAAPDRAPQPVPYSPRPGDLCICDDFNKFRHTVYKWAGTAAPTHICMVIADTQGKPALLELTGPRLITSKVVIMDVEDRFNSYPGEILIRRLKEPLTPEQSKELTDFAYSQEGKRFALGRVILQASPFNARSGWRKTLFGKTHFDRTRWFCSEIVVAAGTKAQIFDRNQILANATYPRDLAFDETFDLSAQYHAPVLWSSSGETSRVGPVARPVSRQR